jgi:hypothetical protein
MKDFLQETSFLDFKEPEFEAFLKPFEDVNSEKFALDFYSYVRDFFLYDPYHLDLRPEALSASFIIQKKRAWCVEKAIVFAAGLRAKGIPARLGYAIVENHIGVERLTSILRTPKIVFHGYVDVYLEAEHTWTKATPAFDRRVCKLSGVEPLVWDGKSDSLFQEFSGSSQFMEYHHDYGVFSDVPVQLMTAEMRKHYPQLFDGSIPNTKTFSFYFDESF